MRVLGLMRCRGVAPPNVYTSSSCFGVHRRSAASAGTLASNGRGVAPGGGGAAIAEDVVEVFRHAASIPAALTGAVRRNRRREVMSALRKNFRSAAPSLPLIGTK